VPRQLGNASDQKALATNVRTSDRVHFDRVHFGPASGERIALRLVMRPAFAAMPVLCFLAVLLVVPAAWAQLVAGQSPSAAATPVEVPARASFDTSALLALYMAQLAAAGSAPSQADVDEAARQYFTNGAAVTGVPSSGPGAAYFHDGAAVTGVPSSGPGAAYFHDGAAVMAYNPAPRVTPAPEATGEPNTRMAGTTTHEEDARVQSAVASTQQASVAPTRTEAAPQVPGSEARTEPSTATGLTCSPLEIEAAMAIARQFATAAAPPATVTSGTPIAGPLPVPPPAALALAIATEPVSNCLPGRSLLSRIAATALGGVFFGGFAVALWLRRRPLAVAPRRRNPG
jgi:hypothetical protein